MDADVVVGAGLNALSPEAPLSYDAVEAEVVARDRETDSDFS